MTARRLAPGTKRWTLGLVAMLAGEGCGSSGAGGRADSDAAPGEAESEGSESEGESEASSLYPTYISYAVEPTPESGDRAFLLYGVLGGPSYAEKWTSPGSLLPDPPVVFTHRVDLDTRSVCLVDARHCERMVDCPSNAEVEVVEGGRVVELDDPVVSISVGAPSREIAQPYECDANAFGFVVGCDAATDGRRCVANGRTDLGVVPLGDPARCGTVCVTYEPDSCAEDLPRDSAAPCACPDRMCHDGVCRPWCRR